MNRQKEVITKSPCFVCDFDRFQMECEISRLKTKNKILNMEIRRLLKIEQKIKKEADVVELLKQRIIQF